MGERALCIKTDFWMKPIPVRRFDWSAWDDGIGEEGPTGYGATEDEAINELMNTTGPSLSEREKRGQAMRCSCQGSNDLCACQNTIDITTSRARTRSHD